MSNRSPEKAPRARSKRHKSLAAKTWESSRALARAARLATVGEITACITHEVNQPLAAILNNAETGLLLFQRQQASSEMLHTILEEIRSEALRASAIVRRTRALLQDREMVRQPVNIDKLVADAVRMLWSPAQRRGVTLSASSGCVPAVDADEVHLQQVLVNLITNAVDATEQSVASPKRVEVSTAHRSGKVVVSVRDTGCGIPPGQFQAIFEPFYTDKTDGLGIGLSMARFIVKAHAGRIFAENNQGGPGATVSFELPVSPRPASYTRSPRLQREEC